MLRIALLFALATVTLGSSQLDAHLWEKYKSLHHKAYSTKEEGVRRLIWEKTLLKIVKHNMEAELGLHTYKLGINQFSDMTDEEFSSRLNSFIEGTKEIVSTLDVPPLTKVPDEIDWRKEGLVTHVKDQGKCGSCWAFSVTGALEGLHKKKTGKLVPLSEQQLIDCSGDFGNHGCDGGNVAKAFKYIIESGGVDTEDSYPYEGKKGECRFNMSNVGATMKEMKRIAWGEEDSLKFAVGHYGPVSVGINVYSASMRHYKEGVFVDHKCSSRRLNHAALVVGYGTENGQDYWLVKNSWGTKWGDAGYIKMARNHNNMCGIATFASFPL